MTLKRTIEYLAIFCLSFLFFAWYQFQTPYLPETDGYYHIKVAWLLGHSGFISNFKWAHLSIWRDHYSDKEFLYHVYLIPFTFFKDLAFGGKLATVTMGAIVFTSFYSILRLNKIRYAWFWLLLLSMSGGYFLYRVNVPRPQGLSIVFVLWSLHFLLNRKRVHLAILCFIYTYSYTAYHLPFIFAGIIYIYQLIFEKENDWKTPALVFLATLAGMLLSPFFPNNFTMFYLQNFYVLWKGAANQQLLHMGGEFWPMDTRELIGVNIAVVISMILAFFTALRAPFKVSNKTIELFLISLALILLTCLSKRFTEYSVPVTLLFCGFYFSPYLAELDWYALKKWRIPVIGLAVITMLSMGCGSYYSTIDDYKGASPSGLEPAALWLKAHTNDNELVYTGDWDDAPELFYFNHKDRYLVFLDPNFMYYWNPRIWQIWDSLSNGKIGNRTFDVLKNTFHVRYGVATNDFFNLKNIILNDPRMKVVDQTPNAYVFSLDTLAGKK